MAFTKAQLENLKNTLLASNQPILANQHREQIQSLIDEMFDAQTRGNILVGVQADSNQGANDTFIIFRNGQAFQIPLNLLSATSLTNLSDVFISNLSDGDTLIYNSVNDRFENQSILLGFELSNLSDVELANLFDGDILRYNNATDKWDNVSLSNILAPYAFVTDLDAYQLLSEKGQANGYAQLDTGAKLPISIIPDSVLGQVEYQGTWNASTNTPTLPTTPDKKGDYYVVSTAGTFVGIDFEIGDWIISNGVEWEKVNNTDAVRTVFGRLGDVVANANDYASFYVTLNTNQTISGVKTFDNRITANVDIRLIAKGSAAATDLKNIDAPSQVSSGSNGFGFNNANNIYFSGSNKGGGIFAFNNSSTRIYTLPNATGTIALTSDLHAALTLGTANGLSLTGQQLSLELASTNTTGALSDADFSIFNAKVGGSGTTNFLSKFTGSGTIGSSAVFENGGNVGIGTTAPASLLHIFQNTATTGTDTGLTVQQSGTGDAILQFVLTNARRWVLGADNSDNDKFKISSTENLGSDDRFVIDVNGNVGIGATSDRQLTVNGQARVGTPVDFWNLTGPNASNFFTNQGFIGTNGAFRFDIVAGGYRNSSTQWTSTNINSLNRAVMISANANTGTIDFRTDAEKLTGSGVDVSLRWQILSNGIFQSNGEQTIQTSSGNLTLATASGNGNIVLSPHGTGNVGIGTTNPLSKLEVIGNASIGFTADAAVAAPTNGLIVNGIVGIGINNPATSAILDLTSTTRALLITRMTTTQRDALTAVNGMILYNTTLNKFQGYENGAWANLI